MAAVVSPWTAQAEEKNGVLLLVTKKTLERTNGIGDNFGKVDKVQGLAVTVKNNSFRELPAGEVQWTILVRRASSGELLKYSGTEPLAAMKGASGKEIMLGAAQTSDYRPNYASGTGYSYKDKTEYEVVIVNGGKETIRTSSDRNFATLAANATVPEGVNAVPAAPAIAQPPVTPGPAEPTAAVPPPMVKPVAPVVAPAVPAAKPTEPAAVAEPPAPKPAPKAFDFFDVRGAKK